MPNLESLTAAITTQFASTPFENITSLSRRLATGPTGPVPPLDLDQLTANWQARSGGGVCYEIATVFFDRMRAEGYPIRQVLAQISFPDGHMAAVTTLNGRDFLVDVGTGSPVFAPIPLDTETHLTAAGLPFRFRPDSEPGYFLQERNFDGEWKTSTRYDLSPLDETRRETAYQRHHTFGQSWVVDRLRMIKWDGDHTCHSISGNELTTITCAGKETRTLSTLAEFQEVADTHFGVPNLPIEHAWTHHPTFFT